MLKRKAPPSVKGKTKKRGKSSRKGKSVTRKSRNNNNYPTSSEMMNYSKVKTIPLTNIILTDPIANEIKKGQPGILLEERGFKSFKKGSKRHGLPLGRMNKPQKLDKPIRVVPFQVMKNRTLYNINNGRHRFVKSFLEGRETIRVIEKHTY
jgi:hypothetical protein